MKKHPKVAYGIFHDGLSVRLAHLSRENGDVYLHAVDHTDLDRYWYKILEDPSVSMVDAKTQEDKVATKGEVKIDEFDNDYVANYQLQPTERMLASFDLSHGVVALNVYEDNIVKDGFDIVSKKDMDAFVKSKMSAKLIKADDWQSSIVNIGGQRQHWLHSGTNRLLDMLHDYQKSNHISIFFQLADANDIALTDYFAIAYESYLEKDTLLVYLGQEYRKAFLFKDRQWADTLKLQITQSIPEPEVISSKLALAIDSAQLKEPEVIVICGDMANAELVNEMKSQFPSARVELLEYHNIVVAMQSDEPFDMSILNQYTLPIALAYKALFPEDPRFTSSNFLPSRIIEGQKVFKIAWHGFVVLFLIFALALTITNLLLKETLHTRQAKFQKRDLDFRLAQKRNEAEEIQKIRTELDNQDKNIQVLKDLLNDKNPWTETLNIANRAFSGQPQSWLTNLKVEGGVLFLSGVTTRRGAIIEFAKAFPESQIHKVSHTIVRNKDLWTFEMTSALPKVDWMGEIQRDVESLLMLRQKIGENNPAVPSTDDKKVNTFKTVSIRPIAPQKVKSQIADKSGKAILLPLPQSSCPIPPDEDLTGDGEDIQDYYAFVASANRGNIWEYRDVGNSFVSKNPHSKLLPVVRWWISYRLYLDKEYPLAVTFLLPMLNSPGRYHPYALLLQARLDYALGNKKYEERYGLIKNDYGRHPLMSQVNADLEAINNGGGK
ncbi:MAG: hypothetical protein PHY48_03635 [Candidatus Cloacimonetes bacterium]|nr:hypothetical protein [Candidatus Cloacimonadota bacterium]